MKILLIKDVFKLGRAGDVKKVADGYGRNYLIPQGLAILATPGALKQADRIRSKASERREALNNELGGLAEQIEGLRLLFSAKAGDSDKLYGSITTQQIADAVEKETSFKIKKQQIEVQPIRTLGKHIAKARLTMDLVPEFNVVVYREGEAAPAEGEEYVPGVEEEENVEASVMPEAVEELDASEEAEVVDDSDVVEPVEEAAEKTEEIEETEA
ncbi:MAG: 50S ribosomal protein L9 [Anaerolineales bacterium]|uniref:Large ribosomal subunit protein bL9 n=1 Tax=Candidatus Desulfolinea nitratireducens TaxID=2841698 RepID=A0A8J6NL52_9CHLR|nr:50S ribosomal protein L9 [Candidatus Desulfolinea nitratireducens]